MYIPDSKSDMTLCIVTQKKACRAVENSGKDTVCCAYCMDICVLDFVVNTFSQWQGSNPEPDASRQVLYSELHLQPCFVHLETREPDWLWANTETVSFKAVRGSQPNVATFY